MKLRFVLGPCVIESRDQTLTIAEALAKISLRLDLDLYFKASFDKANRTRLESYRGPGLQKGLKILEEVKAAFGLELVTDIHLPEQAHPAAQVVDVLQIPAFLCRQTDLLTAAADTGRIVHVKKGQFLHPLDIGHILDKLKGAKESWITERGTSFGRGELVIDPRAMIEMTRICHERGAWLLFDATHSTQRWTGEGTTGGDRSLVQPLAQAAICLGAQGIFAEVHQDPAHALSDAATQLPLKQVAPILKDLMTLHQVLNEERRYSAPSTT